MSSSLSINNLLCLEGEQSDRSLASSITRKASTQTYYTIRLLVDRNRVRDAYRAYGYFRWVDDWLDRGGRETVERIAFVERQNELIDRCYLGNWTGMITVEEGLLVELIHGDKEKNSGLQSYIRNMMAVMAFDAERKGRLITQQELTDYTHCLATAVTEAMHYFIGQQCKSPQDCTRYLAVTAAHISHMLRDTLDDTQNGYFNIPSEYLAAHEIGPEDVWSDPYRRWVQSRVEQARNCFKNGLHYLARVENPRCRLAGYAYTARFMGVLDAIEQDGYRLRSEYPKYHGIEAGLRICLSILTFAYRNHHLEDRSHLWQAR